MLRINCGYWNAEPPDAGLSTHLVWINGDSIKHKSKGTISGQYLKVVNGM